MSTITAPTSPIEAVQSLYAAFGRGDIPAIIHQLAPNVEWRVNVDPAAPGTSAIPTFRVFRGKTAVPEFFSALRQALEIHSFQPVAFMAGDREVTARILVDATVRSSGARLRLEALHHWTFDPAGTVTRFIDFQDTLAVASAWATVRAS